MTSTKSIRVIIIFKARNILRHSQMVKTAKNMVSFGLLPKKKELNRIQANVANFRARTVKNPDAHAS